VDVVQPKAKDMEGYFEDPTAVKYNREEKHHYMPTMATIKKGKKDDKRLHKPTVYDLAGQADWRTNTAGNHMAGPIDHVSKNKAAFSNQQ